MPCEYCGYDIRHDYRCPLYEQPKSIHKCDICGNGILNGEEYIMNECNNYAHLDCINTIGDMLKWLDCQVYVEDENED